MYDIRSNNSESRRSSKSHAQPGEGTKDTKRDIRLSVSDLHIWGLTLMTPEMMLKMTKTPIPIKKQSFRPYTSAIRPENRRPQA
jgi:hypothetical protein